MYRELVYGNYSESLVYNENSSSFDKEQKKISKYFKKNYDKYFKMYADKDISILDLGCGLGHYILAAKECGYNNIYGVDGSESCVAECKRRGIVCEQSDILDFLKIHEDEYDVIVFNDVIEHFHKDEVIEVLQAIKKSLKPSGMALIKTINMANPLTACVGRYMDFTHETGFNEISMRQVLLAVGFKENQIIGTDIYVVYFPFNYVCKVVSKLFNALFYLINCLYGRTTVKIFEKDILAIARK